MQPNRWNRIQELFEQALDRPAAQRAAFVKHECDGDAELHAELTALLAAHAAADPFLDTPTPQAPPEPRALSNGRFEVRERLGKGGFGVVYHALDRRTGSNVALKLLRDPDAEMLYRFKREFRALADLSHPSLIALHELLADGEQWFFTMELVDGEPFRDFAARDAPGEGRKRLRGALRQIAEGVASLHARGRLHRDLKPSNVLVDRAGRVKILDFGMVSFLGRTHEERSGQVGGTPAYMAPESGSVSELSEASDWYAVGVMLFEALTGGVPFAGEPIEVILAKRGQDAPLASTLAEDVPADLDMLCAELLRRDPAARPTAAEVLRRLSAQTPGESSAAPRPTPFVGRGVEIEALRQTFETSRGGRPAVALVHGRSGMGKTALVRRFLLEVSERWSDVMVLEGRCYERESVPYKAIDSVVDALGRHLRILPAHQAEALLPRDAAALGRLFPTLRQAVAVASARPRSGDMPDSAELRRRGTFALRELLARLALNRSLVIFVDDLQWGDLDSAALLGQLLRPPDAPPLLLIGAYRSEDAGAPVVAGLTRALAEAVEIVPIGVGELPDADARRLAAACFMDAEAQPIDRIVAECRGNPFFLRELAREPERLAEGGSLDDVLWQRISRLPEPAQRMLEVVAVAAQPIQIALVEQGAGVDPGDPRPLDALREARLVRVLGDGSRIEASHDRIRETVLERLPRSRLEAHLLRLASVFEQSGQFDPEALARLYHGAGDSAHAATLAAFAGERAAAALAFDRAVELFRMALECGVPDQARVREKLADALALKGNSYEAAQMYMQAVEGRDLSSALELRRCAGEQFLRSGHVDEGLAVVGSILRTLGLKMPRTSAQARAALAWRRARLRLRGLRFRERSETALSARDRMRIDTCWTVAVGLGFVDTLRGATFQAQNLLLALKAGEPYRIARALALELGYASALDGSEHPRTRQVARRARDLATRLGHPHVLALVDLTTGIGYSLMGRWREALAACDRAETLLRERCAGVTWERNTAQTTSISALVWLGQLREVARRLPAFILEARERGDIYGAMRAQLWTSCILHLANDDPDAARRQVAAVMSEWSHTGFEAPQLWALSTLVQTDLYVGLANDAWQRVEQAWQPLQRSFLLRPVYTRCDALRLRVRAALASAVSASDRTSRLRIVREHVDQLDREDAAWAGGLLELLRAGWSALGGDTPSALSQLAAGEAGCRDQGLELYAACARFQRGQLLGGVPGRELAAEAAAWMAEHDIRRPERMAAVLVPGPWPLPDSPRA